MAPPVDKKSRYNTLLRFGWATIGSLFGSIHGLNVLAGAAIGTIAGDGGVTFFNSLFSRSSSTVDQAYQPAWIWKDPQADAGYLVVQPHHYRRWHMGKDRIDFHQPPRILGYTQTLEQAQFLCERHTHDQGLVADMPLRADPRWALWHKAWKNFTDRRQKILETTETALTGIWQQAAVSPGSAQSLAFRSRITPQGPQWEFFPLPPQLAPTPKALRQQMASQWGSNDRLLPEKGVDSHILTDHAEVAAAWRFQALTHQSQHTVPWQFLNVAEPGTPPRWTLGCATPGKHATDPPVWHFWPESGPLVTWPDLETARQAINRVAAPHTDLSTWPINAQPDPTLMTTWRHAVGLADPPNIPTATPPLSVTRRATVSSS
ncbi:hypothetical protein SAMN00768000_3688 [Sulfobacillus thermosulfidooxidans DSM 9293]|uniref:Uncharacterized protein n=1 Tax=Sulfobacillus thermosulfidooxidans (strain DSM 9293 / VKM B-1269 / AT-1) TaxID=929705 RepID=A0A1W1WPB9_SULTA|nr:hypothetical protein [Sulfobacillus thermosulfidooxidans]SMC08151.1 hypothetical protein SAMN00768000_3688 [Sulfobacillus thermosulfidooxidans DSM 9293]